MKKSIGAVALVSLMIFAFSSSAHGAGFLIYEHGAAAMAMGGAFIGLANDVSAIFHNPAGVAWLEGTQISAGTTLIFPSTTLTLDNWPDPNYQTIEMESKMYYPSTFYISHKFSDKIAGGFGFFNPYGLGAEWPDPENFPLRYLATKSDMKTFFFNPMLACKLNDNLSIGFGVSYIYAMLDYELTYLLDLTGLGMGVYDIPVTLENTTGSAWGLNAGALYKGDKFSFGFNWRGGFDIDYAGDLALDMSPVPVALPENGTVETTFSFPHIFGIGAAFNLSEQFTLTADIHYILWSCFEEIVVETDVPGMPMDLDFPPIVQNFENSLVFRYGGQYKPNENIALRVGFLYDNTPQPVESMDPMLPDANRWALTLGFGYNTGKLVIDLAYQYEPFLDRTSPNRDVYPADLGEGTYSTTAHLFGISFIFKF